MSGREPVGESFSGTMATEIARLGPLSALGCSYEGKCASERIAAADNVTNQTR